MLPVAFQIKPNVDTQGSPAQVAQGLTASNLIRIKNGYIQKLGGCLSLGKFLYTEAMQVLLAWSPEISGTEFTYLAGASSASTQIFYGGTGYDITSAAATGIDNTLALWGSWLLNASVGETIYYWTPVSPPSGNLVAVSTLAGATGVPTAVNGIFVAAPQQQAFAWGVYSASLGAQDPLLLAWCDIANLQDWTASAINQAGTFRLSSGSTIVAGTWSGQNGLIWTDIELWAANYTGFPLVYGFNRIGENCGLIGLRAWGKLGTRIAWMSYNDFFLYEGGAVRPIPCSVRDFVFNSINRKLPSVVHCDVNTFGNEFLWRFPQGNSNRCTAYVKWSPDENNAWDYGMGDPEISAWADASFPYVPNSLVGPVGVDYSVNVLLFENAIDFNGAALDSFYQTGWFYIAEGQEEVFVERVMPDFVFNSQPGFHVGAVAGTMTMTFDFADEIPSDPTDYPIRTYGPYTVTEQTPYIIVRGTGRVMRITVHCTDGATFYRNGKHLARAAPTGRAR